MKAWRILVADELSPEGIALLETAGEVTVRKGMDEAALRAAVVPYHALVVRSATVVTARSLELAQNLAVIGRAGIGVDNIDVEAATARGIVVMNTPEAGATTTGELAISLLLSLARNIPAADASMKRGEWEKSRFTGTELAGKTLGVLGLGRIGRVVADRGKGLHMQVIAHDPFVDESQAPPGVRLVSLDELLAESDFVSVHVPLMDETRHLLGRERLAQMKKGARLIHAARGGIVDDDAVCDALDSGHLAGAALDVFEREPLPKDHRLLRTENLVLTPHLGASTKEAKRSVSLEMARQVVVCLQRGIVLNGVNVPRIAPSEAALLEPFLKLAHHLASFLVQVRSGPIQSMRLTLQGDVPATAQRPLTVAMLTGALQHRVDALVTPVNAERYARDLGVRVHAETSTLKRDFVHLIRVEAVLDGERHFVTGTVLGHRHIRMIEYDAFLLDAIPEGPLLVTWHRDQPGVVGKIGTLLGEQDINISRLQLGGEQPMGELALGIWNLSSPITDSALDQLRADDAMVEAHRVDI
jgi:D-3-phosphoglycerate dehydrogenase